MRKIVFHLMAVCLCFSMIQCKSNSGEADSNELRYTGWEQDKPVPKAVIQSTRSFRERLLSDPHRPGYHFVVPEDKGIPGDPNGAFYANGRYHLMYLYLREEGGFSYGHVSSRDLLHWRHHPDAIGEGRPQDGPGNQEDGVFSGGAFVDDDGTAYITYWQFVKDWQNDDRFADGKLGIAIAKSSDKHFDNWTKIPENPVIPSTHWGITVTKDQEDNELIYGSADPSQIWKKDGKYYMLTGNLLVLRKYGSGELARADSLQHQGDHLYLFESEDLKKWDYVGEFYQRNPDWTEVTEDNMCPSFLPLPSSPNGGPPSDKYLLLFISHNLGCQYYVGSYDDDQFFPENHGRMTWVDNDYFAPEALLDVNGRQIMWAWMHDGVPDDQKEMSGDERWEQNHYGWTGTFGLPRSLWLGEDGTLRMRPIKELETLRYNQKENKNLLVASDSELEMPDFGHELEELEIVIAPDITGQAGVLVNCSDDGREQTSIYYDASSKQLCVDATKSSLDYGVREIEKAPFELGPAEPLELRIFVDRSVVEVFANDRQAIARRIYPRLGGTGVKLFAKGGDAKVISASSWEIMPSNPY